MSSNIATRPSEGAAAPTTPLRAAPLATVACRASDIHSQAHSLLSAAQSSLTTANERFPLAMEVQDLVDAAKADVKDAFAVLPTLRATHPELLAAVKGTVAVCPCVEPGGHAGPEEVRQGRQEVTVLQGMVECAKAWIECIKAAYETSCAPVSTPASPGRGAASPLSICAIKRPSGATHRSCVAGRRPASSASTEAATSK